MYSYIKGTIEEVYEDLIVVENGGIGYNIHVPLRVLDELPGAGRPGKDLYISACAGGCIYPVRISVQG